MSKVDGEKKKLEEVKKVEEVKPPVDTKTAPAPIPAPPTIELGDLVRDVTSGYEGIVIGIAAYLFKDASVQLQRYTADRTSYKEPLWFNGRQLKLVRKAEAQKVME